MYRCAILDDYQNVALAMADWSVLANKIQIQNFTKHFLTEDELINGVIDYDMIVIMRGRTPFNASVFARLPKLKLLITSGMRNPAIDLEAATKAGVIVVGTASTSDSPAELTWALILNLARHIQTENKNFRMGSNWQSTLGISLKNKKLGLLGLGKIGAQVARVGKAFGMEVIAWSQNLTEEKAIMEGVQLAASKEELLRVSDIISIHLVLSERTKHLISFKEFLLMKPSALLINTARAEIIDQVAMIQALQAQQIAGVASDVFDIEPLPNDHPLRTLPNFLGTPHLGYVTDRNYKIYFREAVENILAFLEGKTIRELSLS